jgi:sulfonate transport system substrate-binding protein
MRIPSPHPGRPTRPVIPTSGRRRHRASLLAAVLASAAVLSACGSSSGGAGSSTRRSDGSSEPAASVSPDALRIGDQAGTGAQALLNAAGLLHKLPFKVSWADFTSGPPMLQALSAGSLDLGGVGDAPPVFAAAGGARIAVVGALATNPQNAGLLVPKDSTIHSISQLKGKKIAVAQGSSADYHLLTVLRKAGLSVHDVTLEYLQPAEGLAALSSGNVDAWDVWAPFIQEATAQQGARILVNGVGYGSNYSYEVAAKDSITNAVKAKEIREYLTALDKAHLWADRHPAAWAAVWAQATGLPASVMTKAAEQNTARPVPVNSTIVSAEQGLVDGFYTAGLIPRKFNFADYSYDGFNGTVGSGS